jgi:predicted HD superfamily hydrolase involved in NAD metabolism
LIYTEKELGDLSSEVSRRVTQKRFCHILGVEKCAERLAKVLIPQQISEVRAAALLHDVSKELPLEYQLDLLKNSGFEPTEEDIRTVGVIHSFTAPIVVARDFKKFATDDILSAVLKHTVGDEEMSIFDKIIFISDYVEDTRRYESCIMVRNLLFNGFDDLSYSDKLIRLNDACIAAIDSTYEALTSSNNVVNSRMLKTRKSLESKIIP